MPRLFEWKFQANTPPPLPLSTLALSSCRQQVQILARKCAARRQKSFPRIPDAFLTAGNIGNHQQETKRVAGCKLVFVCLLPVARCTLPVARCLLPVACCLAALLTRAWPIMRRAPSGEIDEDAQMQTHSANGQYGAADGVLCTICGPDNYGQNSQPARQQVGLCCCCCCCSHGLRFMRLAWPNEL